MSDELDEQLQSDHLLPQLLREVGAAPGSVNITWRARDKTWVVFVDTFGREIDTPYGPGVQGYSASFLGCTLVAALSACSAALRAEKARRPFRPRVVKP